MKTTTKEEKNINKINKEELENVIGGNINSSNITNSPNLENKTSNVAIKMGLNINKDLEPWKRCAWWAEASG